MPRSAPTNWATKSLAGRARISSGGVVLLEHAALAHDRDAVAHLDRLVDVVRDEHDRLFDFRLQGEELVLQVRAVDRVDRAERLVHQHQRRVGRERARDADALALAAGELRRIAARHLLGVEADQREQLLHARVGAVLLPAEQPRHGRDVLGDRQVREQPDLLDHVADLAAQLAHVAVQHALPAEQDLAAAQRDHAVDQAHRRRLAAARRADQHAEVAGRDREREVADRRLALARVALADVAQLQLGRLSVGGGPLQVGVCLRLTKAAPGRGGRVRSYPSPRSAAGSGASQGAPRRLQCAAR